MSADWSEHASRPSILETSYRGFAIDSTDSSLPLRATGDVPGTVLVTLAELQVRLSQARAR